MPPIFCYVIEDHNGCQQKPRGNDRCRRRASQCRHPGIQPEQTQPNNWLTGTLRIAGQIIASMPAVLWVAATTRLVDRMSAFVAGMFGQVMQQGVPLTEDVPGRVTGTGAPVRSSVRKVEQARPGDDSGGRANGMATTDANSSRSNQTRSAKATNGNDRISRNVVNALIAEGLAHRIIGGYHNTSVILTDVVGTEIVTYLLS